MLRLPGHFTADAVIHDPHTYYVRDDFEARSPQTDTWTSAPIGGDYTGDSALTDIVAGRGVITHSAASNNLARLPSATASVDHELRATFTFDKMPSVDTLTLRLRLRMNTDLTDSYLVQLEWDGSGNVDVLGQAFPDGVAGTIVFQGTWPTDTFSNGTEYTVVAQVEGSNPTTLRVKIYQAVDPEPTTWDFEATDSTTELQGLSGIYGLGMRTRAALTNFPIAISFKEWQVTDIVSDGTTISDDFTADAILLKSISANLSADAILRKDIPSGFTADSVLRGTPTSSLTADSILKG